MIPVRYSAVRVHFDDAHAELHASNMSVFDDHDIANSLTRGLGFPNPPIPPIFPVHARVSFDLIWDGALATARIQNTPLPFKGPSRTPEPPLPGLPIRLASTFSRITHPI